MRDIKFRGKEIDTGKWVLGFYLEQDIYNMGSKNTKRDLLIKDAGVIVQNSKCNSGTVIDKNTIGQYTGLKDKNGKEIYEGDIVEIKGYSNKGYNTGLVKEIYVVEFKDFCWSCGTKSLLNLATINWASIEVIGNIYDNPELLKEKE